MKSRLPAIVLLLACGPLASCNRSYDALLQAGKKRSEVPLQFEELYGPQAVRSGIGGASSSTHEAVSLWSVTHCESRYQISFEANMNVDGARILSSEPGTLQINEITAVTDHGQGRIETSYGRHWTITAAQWADVYRAHGDFSVIGIDLRKNQPVPDFSLYTSAESFGK